MNLIKKLLKSAQFVVIGTAMLFNAVSAEQVYSGDFLKYKYTVYDSSIAGEKNISNVSLSQDALPGKTEIEFDFSVTYEFTSAVISIAAQSLDKTESVIPVSFMLAKDDVSFKLDCENVTVASFLEYNKTYSLVAQIDLKGGKCNAVLYENHEKNKLVKYKSGISLKSEFPDYGITGVSVTGNVSVSSLTAFRERTAGSSPVTEIDSVNNIVTVSAELSENIEKGSFYDIYAAFYKDSSRTRLADTVIKTCRCFDNYVEAVFDLSDNFKNENYSVSVFAMRPGNIAPLALSGRVLDNDSYGVSFNMECAQKTSWYTLGQTVTYTLTADSLLDNAAKICGLVYDSDGILTASVMSELADVQKNGWTYKPVQSGYYKVIFYAVTLNNRIVYEYRKYDTIYDKYLGGVKLDKSGHNFYVTAFENMDWEKRNKLYGMSIDRYDGEYDMDIAKQLGMSFIRLHAFSWKDIQPTQDGELVWVKEKPKHDYEAIFNRIASGDKFDVIANILYTPQWASSHPEETDVPTYDFPNYAKYAPSDNKFLTDFIDKLYEKYGKYITAWEIYNEPNINKSMNFWYDTTENYVSMLKAAYEEIKILSGNDTNKSKPDIVTLGGLGPRYYVNFYKEFLANGGWDYTDKFSMHGQDIDPWNYFKYNDEQDENKGVINTEAHMMLFSRPTDNFEFTEKQIALRTFTGFLKQIKYGVEQIALFQPYDNHVMGEDVMKFNEAYYNDGKQWAMAIGSIFRKKPSVEPRFVAGALNTLIAKSGTVTEYVDEYRTGNVNIVKLTADGKPLYIVWGDDLAAQSADADLSGITDSAVITDWEGRILPLSGFTVCTDKVYFIEGLSDSSFSYLNSVKGTEPYLGEVLYSNYEKGRHAFEGPSFIHSDGSVYNRETGVINTDNAKWNDMYNIDETVVKGQLAVYVSNDGLECVMKVSNTDSEGNEALTSTADMFVGVDTLGNGVKTNTVQFIANFNSKYLSAMKVYKSVMPYIGGDIVNGTPLNEKITDADIRIVEGDRCRYFCIFIPAAELYPFNYDADYKVNIGVKFTGYNGSAKSCWCRVNKDYDYNVNSPWRFANFKYADKPKQP